MNKNNYKSTDISLSSEVYDGWDRYCKYHNMTHDEAISKIVEQWESSNQMKAQVIQAELNGELDE